MHAVSNTIILGSGLTVDWVFVQDCMLLLYQKTCVQLPDFSQLLVTAEACTASTSGAVEKQLYANISSV